MSKDKKPFFIVSSGRSGTTLLSSILNASEQVMIPPESDFIARAFPFYFYKKVFTESDYREFVHFFCFSSQRKQWKIDEKWLFEEFKRLRPKNFRDVNSVIYNSYLKKIGASDCQWGIKRPVLIASIDRILNVFNDALIVHLVRDGRDVALSYMNSYKMGENFGPKNIISCSLYWVDGLRRIEEVNRKLLLEIKYEDILLNPAPNLIELCKFLNIKYDSQRFDNYHLSSRGLNIISSKHMNTIHKKVQGGLDPKNISKYKNTMSKFDLFFFEIFSAPYLFKYGYELEFPFLTSRIFALIRFPFFLGARFFNIVRYHFRDKKIYRKAKIQSQIPF